VALGPLMYGKHIRGSEIAGFDRNGRGHYRASTTAPTSTVPRSRGLRTGAQFPGLPAV